MPVPRGRSARAVPRPRAPAASAAREQGRGGRSALSWAWLPLLARAGERRPRAPGRAPPASCCPWPPDDEPRAETPAGSEQVSRGEPGASAERIGRSARCENSRVPRRRWAERRGDGPRRRVQVARQAAALGCDGDRASRREPRAACPRPASGSRRAAPARRGQAARTASERDRDPAHGPGRGAQRVEDRGGARSSARAGWVRPRGRRGGRRPVPVASGVPAIGRGAGANCGPRAGALASRSEAAARMPTAPIASARRSRSEGRARRSDTQAKEPEAARHGEQRELADQRPAVRRREQGVRARDLAGPRCRGP